jgi:hypothetical protein
MLKVNPRFGGTFRLQLQIRRINQARYQYEADSNPTSNPTRDTYHKEADSKQGCLVLDGFLLGLNFDPEDGSDMFLRNIS